MKFLQLGEKLGVLLAWILQTWVHCCLLELHQHGKPEHMLQTDNPNFFLLIFKAPEIYGKVVVTNGTVPCT